MFFSDQVLGHPYIHKRTRRKKHGLNFLNGSGKFNPAAELSLLPFIFNIQSLYICRPCKQLLMKIAALRTNPTGWDGNLRKFQSTHK